MRHSLFVVLIGVIVWSAATAQVETQAPGARACALRQPTMPRQMGFGIVIRFQTPDAARADIPNREARLGGSIDPRYLNDQRAVVRQDNGKVQIFDVPQGLMVRVGERVRVIGSYRSKDFPCSYIPILITPGAVS